MLHMLAGEVSQWVSPLGREIERSGRSIYPRVGMYSSFVTQSKRVVTLRSEINKQYDLLQRENQRTPWLHRWLLRPQRVAIVLS